MTHRHSISEELSALLDDDGLSERSVQLRRRRWDMWSYLISSNEMARYISGSVREGVVSAEDSQSDIDIMYIPLNIVVIDRRYGSAAELSHKRVLIMEDTDHVGFKRITEDSKLFLPSEMEFITDVCEYEYDDVFKRWSNKFAKENVEKRTVQGPAYNVSCFAFVYDVDRVPSLKCRDFPVEAQEWRDRQRLYHWPSQQIVDRIVSIGCHFVAISSSPQKHDEWRVSFSMAENILIRSLNNTQLKCYALLKIVLKSIIKPTVPGVLCSFHMKTIIFWLCEQTYSSFWVRENLHECFIYCVKYLRQYVSSNTCPHYFMRSMNLFENKVNPSNSSQILRIIDEILAAPIKDTVKEILANRKLRDSIGCILLNSFLVNHVIQLTLIYNTSAMISSSSIESECCISDIQSAVDVSQSIVEACPNVLEFSKSCFYLAAVFDSKLKNKLFYSEQRKIFRTLEYHSAFDVCTGRLKLATLYLKINKITKCLALCDFATRKMNSNYIPISFRYNWAPVFRLNCLIDEGLPNAFLSNCIGMDVFFTPLEVGVVPEAVQQEMVREKVYYDREMVRLPGSWCYYDPLIYAYFLMFICYNELGQTPNRDKSFLKLKEVFSSEYLCYREAAFFLIEYCANLCNTT